MKEPTERDASDPKQKLDGTAVNQNRTPQTHRDTNHSHHRKHTWVEKLAIFIAGLAFFASAWQGWVARDSEKRQLRAYVYAVPSVQNFSVGQLVDIKITLKNGGQTPAYNPVFAWGVTAGPYPPNVKVFPHPGKLPVPKFARRGGGAFIYQDHTQVYSWPLNSRDVVPQFAYDDIMVKKVWKFYIYGTVSYLDAFGNRWYTDFCFDLGADSINQTSPYYGYCDYGSGTDNNAN